MSNLVEIPVHRCESCIFKNYFHNVKDYVNDIYTTLWKECEQTQSKNKIIVFPAKKD